MACDKCNKKTKIRSEEEKKLLKNRINRISGQVNGISKMIDEDRYCDDILIQLASLEKTIKSLASVVLENHMKSCMVEDIKEGKLDVVDEIVDLFKRF
jgi:CsoR family transcriptional regulator, copper-sensing transcriptional repressor